MKKTILSLLVLSMLGLNSFSQPGFNGLDMSLGNLYRLSDAKPRSISPENFTGEKGKGGMATLEEGSTAAVANGWGEYAHVNSLAVCANPGSAFNCYWVMPFRKKCRITLTNIDTKPMRLYYQVDYTLTDVPDDATYLHAQFRRVNPLPYKEVYTIVDGITG